MKVYLFALLLTVAGTCAFPWAEDNEIIAESGFESIQRNPAEDRVRLTVERIINRIQGAGLDPLNVERRDFDLNPSFLDLEVKGFVENLQFTGVSDIRINNLEYSYLFNRLRIDVSIPEIKLVVGDASFDAVVRGSEVEGQISGSVSIKELRIVGLVYVDVNIIGQLSVNSISLDSSVGIEADLTAQAQGVDRTEYVNTLLNERVPAFLKDNKADIDGLLERAVTAILEAVWSV